MFLQHWNIYPRTDKYRSRWYLILNNITFWCKHTCVLILLFSTHYCECQVGRICHILNNKWSLATWYGLDFIYSQWSYHSHLFVFMHLILLRCKFAELLWFMSDKKIADKVSALVGVYLEWPIECPIPVIINPLDLVINVFTCAMMTENRHQNIL